MAKIQHHQARALETIVERLGKELGENHKTVADLRAAARRLAYGANALDKVRSSRNPLDTPAAHALKVARMARKLEAEATPVWNACAEIISRGVADAQQRIDKKVDLRPDAFAAEIRAAFRSLDSKGKASLVNKLVKENRGPELAAIVKAPSVLTGITDDQRAAYENMIITAHARDDHDEQLAIIDLYNEVGVAVDAARNFAKALIDPGNLAQIERECAEADEAAAGFDQSFPAQ